MWKCEECNALYQQWLAHCSACGAWHSFAPAPVTTGGQARSQPGPRSRGSLITARALAALDRPSLALSPAWKGLLGSLAPTFGLLAYGPPGAGKSTWLLTLAQELSRLGEVLYVAAEEGQANSMIEKLARLEVVTDRIHISSAISVSEMLDDLERVTDTRFLVIDSLSCFPMSVVELSEIAEKRRLGVAFSLHACKDGSFKGTTSLSHWVDVVVRIEAGQVTLEKNRFGPLKAANLEFKR